jgi:superfamily II DNA or RNA helicase
MATGSGKTLLMHLNYRQFLHYNQKPLDNVLLVTPNEGLTQQHLEQLAASGIPAERFDLGSSGLLRGHRAALVPGRRAGRS